MIQLLLMFLASFFNVFLLGLSSQFVRDQAIALAFTISWGITAAQFIFSRVAAHSAEPWAAYLASGLGGSVGIACSILAYRWLQRRRAA